ncbi:hypothetical protein MTO96_002633 [Rhipicephalus appendiculatus]
MHSCLELQAPHLAFRPCASPPARPEPPTWRKAAYSKSGPPVSWAASSPPAPLWDHEQLQPSPAATWSLPLQTKVNGSEHHGSPPLQKGSRRGAATGGFPNVTPRQPAAARLLQFRASFAAAERFSFARRPAPPRVVIPPPGGATSELGASVRAGRRAAMMDKQPSPSPSLEEGDLLPMYGGGGGGRASSSGSSSSAGTPSPMLAAPQPLKAANGAATANTAPHGHPTQPRKYQCKMCPQPSLFEWRKEGGGRVGKKNGFPRATARRNFRLSPPSPRPPRVPRENDTVNGGSCELGTTCGYAKVDEGVCTLIGAADWAGLKMFDAKAELQLHAQSHLREAKPYRCAQCSKAFANASYLSQHSRIHSGVKPYRCDLCDRKFTQLSHLQQHVRTHTGDKPYLCRHPGCDKAFSQLSNLQSHSRCHQADKPFKCHSCYKCFAHEDALLEHIPRHRDSKHLKTHICPRCGKSYTQETYLLRHMQRHAHPSAQTAPPSALAPPPHPSAPPDDADVARGRVEGSGGVSLLLLETSEQCSPGDRRGGRLLVRSACGEVSVCAPVDFRTVPSQVFAHKSAMQQHSREAHRGDLKPHQCTQCLKSFSSTHQLAQHVRIHTGEKPYKCSYCERRFKQLSHVQQHTRLHTGERPYKCHVAECGRAFIQLSNLQQHLRNHDSQMERAKSRPFHCNICGKGFASDSSLRTHRSKQHAALIGGAASQSCPICHKICVNAEALMEHMRISHKDPPVTAPGTTWTSGDTSGGTQSSEDQGSLRKHVSTHPEAASLGSPLRMWPCTVCHSVFTHETGLLHHMEHMRMDPKHQFAAQYLLSRAAAERREKHGGPSAGPPSRHVVCYPATAAGSGIGCSHAATALLIGRVAGQPPGTLLRHGLQR